MLAVPYVYGKSGVVENVGVAVGVTLLLRLVICT